MKRHGLVATLISLGAVVGLLVPSVGVSAPMTTYAGAGTVVAKQSGQAPLLDDGGAVCLTQAILPVMGLGGGCVSFPTDGRPASIRVQDTLLADQVAFQVCIDMNQDGHCSMPSRTDHPLGPCDDVIGFSHADDGTFYNPLGYYRDPFFGVIKPLPTSIPAPPPGGCPPIPPLPDLGNVPGAGSPWPGYVVFLCEGVHATAMPHAHSPSTGTIGLENQQPFTGAGNFCQTIRDSAKTYFLIP